MMLRCWREDPIQRPTFTQLREELESVISEGGAYLKLDIDENSTYYLAASFKSLSDQTMGNGNVTEDMTYRQTVWKKVKRSTEFVV